MSLFCPESTQLSTSRTGAAVRAARDESKDPSLGTHQHTGAAPDAQLVVDGGMQRRGLGEAGLERFDKRNTIARVGPA